MKNKEFNRAIWAVRKERGKRRPGKKDLAEAAQRYINKDKVKADIKELVRGVIK